MIPGHVEMVRLVELADRIRDTIAAWKDVPRGEALLACIVLAATEAGFEGAHGRDAFLALIAEVAGYAYDLAASLESGSAS